MFSFVPRCQGLPGVGEVDAVGEVPVEQVVAGHLASLVPGQRQSHRFGQAFERGSDAAAHLRGGVVGGQVYELDVSAGSFHQGADRRGVVGPGDQVAFPMPCHDTVRGLFGPVVDEPARVDVARGAPVLDPAGLTKRAPGA